MGSLAQGFNDSLRFMEIWSHDQSLVCQILKPVLCVCVCVWPWQVLVAACEIEFPNQGLNLCPLFWKHGVLTIGPPGKSHEAWTFNYYWPLEQLGTLWGLSRDNILSYCEVCACLLRVDADWILQLSLHWVRIRVLSASDPLRRNTEEERRIQSAQTLGAG